MRRIYGKTEKFCPAAKSPRRLMKTAGAVVSAADSVNVADSFDSTEQVAYC